MALFWYHFFYRFALIKPTANNSTNMKVTLSILIFCFAVTSVSFAQTGSSQAREKKNKAIELMDNGAPEDAIKLLEEAKKLDPESFEYDYEIGFAYYLKKDLPQAIKSLKAALKFKNATDLCYQMLGNMYDFGGDSRRALDTYDEGLKYFPNSGRLFLEKGNVFFGQKKYSEALPFYEKGIHADPAFPSNYYRAALIYCNSSEEVWGMIYGEIFMNLERNSKRTAEISKLLFNTYKRQIVFTSDTSITLSFSKNNVINPSANGNNKNILPFGIGIYGPLLLLSAIGERAIDLESLNRIRSRFIQSYIEKGYLKTNPNVLFDFEKQVLEAGHMEAYNYWILMKGDEAGFQQWQSNNSSKWDVFIQWFSNSSLLP